MNVLYSLQHLGYTIPPQADAGWIGEAGPGPSYLDPGSGGPENDFTNRNTTFMTWNLMHLGAMLQARRRHPRPRQPALGVGRRLPLRLREPRTPLTPRPCRPGPAQRRGDAAAFQSHQARTAASRSALAASSSPRSVKRMVRTSQPSPCRPGPVGRPGGRRRPTPGGMLRWVYPNGATVVGRFVVLVPHRRVVLAYGWEDGRLGVAPGSTTVEIDLVEEDGPTTLRLVHHGLPHETVRDHQQGWAYFLDILRDTLSAG